MAQATDHPRDGGNNGARGAHVPAYSVSVAYDDPMNKVLGLDAKTSGLGAWFGFTSGGTLLAAAGMTLASLVAWWHTAHASTTETTQDIDVVTEAPPPPPAPPPPEPEPETKPAAPPPRAVHEAPPPPPPPAQAAKVLTQEPKPEEPVDLTGNTIVQGNADTYAGGFTTANGSSSAAVNSMPSPTGVPGGTGPVNAPPQAAAPDLSRPASIGAWSCSDFPEEADTAQIDEAYVMIQVDVDANGRAVSAKVLQDPGNGFGRQAKLCAMRQRFQPALDRSGNPVPGPTKAFRVHFSR
jgi:protein TonB